MPAHEPDNQTEPTDADGSDAVAIADDAEAEDSEVEAPMNRAERRAKGKSAGKPKVVGKIQPSHVNTNHGPRSYANRRSG